MALYSFGSMQDCRAHCRPAVLQRILSVCNMILDTPDMPLVARKFCEYVVGEISLLACSLPAAIVVCTICLILGASCPVLPLLAYLLLYVDRSRHLPDSPGSACRLPSKVWLHLPIRCFFSLVSGLGEYLLTCPCAFAGLPLLALVTPGFS